MPITIEQLKAIAMRVQKPDIYIGPLNAAMDEFEINTPQRIAAFLGQILHETNQFLWMTELASGKEYEGRKSLGNTQPGDGSRYKGRGAIQLTGRANYKACGTALGIDLLSKPELAATPDLAFRVAGWFWKKNKINDIADQSDWEAVTKKVNGGTNGWANRLLYTQKALGVLR